MIDTFTLWWALWKDFASFAGLALKASSRIPYPSTCDCTHTVGNSISTVVCSTPSVPPHQWSSLGNNRNEAPTGGPSRASCDPAAEADQAKWRMLECVFSVSGWCPCRFWSGIGYGHWAGGLQSTSTSTILIMYSNLPLYRACSSPSLSRKNTCGIIVAFDLTTKPLNPRALD